MKLTTTFLTIKLWRAINFFEHKIFLLWIIILFLSTWNTFLCCIVFRASPNFCFGHWECYVIVMYFYCHVNQKYNHVAKKFSFLRDTKKIISLFVHHKVFVYNFHIAHCQRVDPLRSGPRNKEIFNSILLTCQIYRSS